MLTTAKASLVYKPVNANLPKSVRFTSDVHSNCVVKYVKKKIYVSK